MENPLGTHEMDGIDFFMLADEMARSIPVDSNQDPEPHGRIIDLDHVDDDSTSAPPPRFDGSMATNAAAQNMVVFGATLSSGRMEGLVSENIQQSVSQNLPEYSWLAGGGSVQDFVFSFTAIPPGHSSNESSTFIGLDFQTDTVSQKLILADIEMADSFDPPLCIAPASIYPDVTMKKQGLAAPSSTLSASRPIYLASAPLALPSSKPRAPKIWASKETWERVKPIIKRLYVDEGRKLKDIMPIMEKEHDLHATPKMYKDRINDWGFGKNFKESDMAVILRKEKQRDPVKKSAFKIKGRNVTIDEVYRYCQRKRTAPDGVLARHSNAPTPPYIFCTTPPLSPRIVVNVPRSPVTPHCLRVPEELFSTITRFISVSFENRTWILTESGELCNTVTSVERFGALDQFFSHCVSSANFAVRGLFYEARKTLSTACQLVPSILRSQDPRTIDFLLDILNVFATHRFIEYGAQLISYFNGVSQNVLNSEDNLRKTFQLLESVDHENLQDILIKSYECTFKGSVGYLGQFQRQSLSSQVSFIVYSCAENLVDAEQQLRKLFTECVEAGVSLDGGVFHEMEVLWDNLLRQGKYAEAEAIAVQIVVDARENGYRDIQVLGSTHAAEAQCLQGKIEMAENNLQDALEILEEHYEYSEPWSLEQVVKIKNIVQNWGSEERAAELAVEVERRMVACGITDDI